jgi:hypothetical protein
VALRYRTLLAVATAAAFAADQVIFHSNAAAGGNAFTGLEAGIIVAAVLMALGCVWGLDVRLAEHR